MAEKAPGRLRLVQDFINTVEFDEDREELSDPAALAGWLTERGLLQAADSRLAQADLARAIELREALRKLLLANNGEPLDGSALSRVERLAADSRLRVRLPDPLTYTLEPDSRGLEGALGRLVAIVLEAMAAGSWERLKACSAEDCMWAFYDSSKNHSRHWCSMRSCGNRAKARQFRRRQRAASPARL